MSTELDRVNQLEEIRGDTPLETVETALSITALMGGSTIKASEELGIPDRTIRDWRQRYPNRYYAAQERHTTHIEGRIVAHQREIVQQASERVLATLDQAGTAENTKALSELAKAAQAFQTTAGIGTTKVLELTGRPTNVTMHVDARDTLKRISSRFTGVIVDSTAVELPADNTNQLPSPRR